MHNLSVLERQQQQQQQQQPVYNVIPIDLRSLRWTASLKN